MTERPPLQGRTVCVHRHDNRHGPHTLPTVVDLFLAMRVLWPLATRLYQRTGMLPCTVARACALAGFAGITCASLLDVHDGVDAVLWLFTLFVPLLVLDEVRELTKMHERLADGQQPSVSDVHEMHGHRRIRVIAVFVLLIDVVTFDPVAMLTWTLFVVWPLYAACVGGPPGPNLRDRAAEGARRLRALLQSVKPRPAFGATA